MGTKHPEKSVINQVRLELGHNWKGSGIKIRMNLVWNGKNPIGMYSGLIWNKTG